MGEILIADNLRKRNISLVGWCCMCNEARKTVDHLLLHCTFAGELWGIVFALFVGDANESYRLTRLLAGPF